MKLALKIDVDTFRGTREGVPNLVKLLAKYGAKATFLFSLGPDHTGRAIKRVFRKDFLKKVQRTSVVEHYGVKTLLYGTLLPGPDIGSRCAHVMRAVRDAGHEAGIHCWDHVRWQDNVALADAPWTKHEFDLAFHRFREIFGFNAKTHGAAGWQTNRHAAWLEEKLFDYASDTRGVSPFIPTWNGVRIGCPQLPTTLPTLDEIIGAEKDPVSFLLEATAKPRDHVFTAHAELEGGRLAGLFDRLLVGWREQGYELVPMRACFDALDVATLPRREVVYGEIPGRSGTLALQGG